MTDPAPREMRFALDPTEHHALLRARYRLALALVGVAATTPAAPDPPCSHRATAEPGNAQDQNRRSRRVD